MVATALATAVTAACMAVSDELDALVSGRGVLALDGPGPWWIGSRSRGPVDLELDDVEPRRVRVSRSDNRLDLVDQDGKALGDTRGGKRYRASLELGDTLPIGHAQVLAASIAQRATSASNATVRWQGMLATGPVGQAQLIRIARNAAGKAPVYIAGESGTGKELAARALHACSARRDGPFVAINCAALPETLAEAELFGVERGAFTGATQNRPGAFVLAHGGTLFLDEVAELPSSVQAKLLRALELGETQAIGSSRTLHVDVRVVTASWRDIEIEAEQERFRHDLVHRLCVLRVELLPLRERPEDVLPLVNEFLRQHERQDLRPDPALAIELAQAAWPGNVRELRNGVLRAIAMHDARAMLPRTRRNRPEPTASAPLGGRRERRSREVIGSTLHFYDGNRKDAARALGVSRSTLYRWLGAIGSPSSRPRGAPCELGTLALEAAPHESSGDGLTPRARRL